MKKDKFRYKEVVNIKDLRKKSIEMLKDIKESLDKHNVKYWLDFGTLLGAVRDGRAIPWDGDFDLSTLDKDIADKKELWKELELKGYNVQITHSNIKITRKNWNIGQYRFDLHRYRINLNGEAEYEYGRVYENKTLNYLFGLSNRIFVLIKPDKNFLRKYPTYGTLCRCLIIAGVNPLEVENVTNLKVVLGNKNSIYDFQIQNKNLKFEMTPEKRSGNRIKIKKKIIESFLEKNPQWLLKIYYNVIIEILKNKKTLPQKRVYYPLDYFSDLEKVSFHNMVFNAPSPKEKYLERIYGVKWKEPVVTKNKDYLNKISK